MHDEGHIPLPALQSDLSQQPQVQIHGGRSAARRALAAGREGFNIVNRYRILIVDDDAMAREILKRILEHAGYEVMTAGSGPEALRKLHEGIPHLVVVDLMMPEMDGFELCRRIKSHLDVPIVILSAVAAVESKVEGLQMYAEDYIVKPFEKEELVARVQRVLRRYGESAGVEQPEVVIDQDLQINFVQHWARVKGQQVTLTPTESKLLFLLVRNAGRVVTNETLLAKAWAGDEEAYEEGLRVHISRLRSKIEPNPSKPVYIQTKRGVGYRFSAKVNYPAGQEPLAMAGRGCAPWVSAFSSSSSPSRSGSIKPAAVLAPLHSSRDSRAGSWAHCLSRHLPDRAARQDGGGGAVGCHTASPDTRVHWRGRRVPGPEPGCGHRRVDLRVASS